MVIVTLHMHIIFWIDSFLTVPVCEIKKFVLIILVMYDQRKFRHWYNYCQTDGCEKYFNYSMNNDHQWATRVEDNNKAIEEETASCVGLHNELNLKVYWTQKCLHFKISSFFLLFYIIRCYCVYIGHQVLLACLFFLKLSTLYFYFISNVRYVSVSISVV